MNDDRLLRNSYRFFTKDHDIGDAVRSFRARYGVLPTEKPWTDDKYLYIGPVPILSLPEGAERSFAGLPVVLSENLPADTVLLVDAAGHAAQARLL